MSTDAMRAALNEILNKEAVYGEVPGLQRPTEFALASYYWRVIGDMKRVARAALAQPVSAEPLTDEAAPVATDARGMLEFLSARFKHAGVSQAVAESYARDIDAILAAEAKPTRVPLTDKQIVALAKQSDGYELRGDHPRMIGFCRGPLVRFARAIERAHGIAC